MTNNLKKAVDILNRIRMKWNDPITDEEYLFLLDFAIKVEACKPDEVIVSSEEPISTEVGQ